MTNRNPAAASASGRRLLRELDAELKVSSKAMGKQLVWTAADRAVLQLIADTADRKADLAGLYAEATEAKTKVKLSAEIRLLETALARLVKQVQTDVPSAPLSRTSEKARHAANVRWAREKANNATG